MGQRLDVADIQGCKLLDVMENLAELLAEPLGLLIGQMNACEFSDVAHLYGYVLSVDGFGHGGAL